MKFRILFAVMCLTFLLGIFVQRQFIHPQVWDEIHIGMSRDEVIKRVGVPPPYLDDKGPTWTAETLTGRNELHLYFSDNKVVIMSIKQRIGTEKYGHTQTIRYEYREK